MVHLASQGHAWPCKAQNVLKSKLALGQEAVAAQLKLVSWSYATCKIALLCEATLCSYSLTEPRPSLLQAWLREDEAAHGKNAYDVLVPQAVHTLGLGVFLPCRFPTPACMSNHAAW